jgi:hypothetical protein
VVVLAWNSAKLVGFGHEGVTVTAHSGHWLTARTFSAFFGKLAASHSALHTRLHASLRVLRLRVRSRILGHGLEHLLPFAPHEEVQFSRIAVGLKQLLRLLLGV